MDEKSNGMQKKTFFFAVLFILALGLVCFASPLCATEEASPHGGMLVSRISQFPAHFIPYLNPEPATQLFSELVLERLVDADVNTLALLPRLAKSWTTS